MRRCFLSYCLLGLLAGCAGRVPIPVGEVPPVSFVTAQDEQYGQEVFNQLSDQYPISHDDEKIRRVRDIVDKLALSIHAQDEPWHIYVLDAPDVKNAAATKGNYIFVWSGMIDAVQSDAELAAILSHELSHVLAGHTQPTPSEEAAEAVAGVSGGIVGQVASVSSGVQIAGQLAEALTKEAMQAIFINPESRRKELEADQIGLFVMADAGYDPQAAITFWKRMAQSGEVDASVPILSTHPQSAERFAALEKMLPQAEARYQMVKSGGLKKESEWEASPAPAKAKISDKPFVAPPTKFDLTAPKADTAKTEPNNLAPTTVDPSPDSSEWTSRVEKNDAGEWVTKH